MIKSLSNIFSGENKDVSITAEGTGQLSLGGNSYTVTYNKLASTEGHIRIQDPSSSGNDINLFPTIETSNGAKVMFYQPQNLTLGSYDDGSTDYDGFRIPDGDGYTRFEVDTNNTISGTDGNWTINSVHIQTIGTVGVSDIQLATGQLNFNLTRSGTNQTTIYLENPSGAAINYPALVIFEEQDDNDVYEALIVRLEGQGIDADGIGVTSVDRTSWTRSGYMSLGGTTAATSTTLTHESNTDVSSAMDLWGSIITIDAGESDQQSATISYPADQIYAEVYVSELDATVTSSGGVVNAGSVSISDAEITQASSNNLIVVGGSCVNTVAAELLGSDAPLCGSDFTDETGAGAGEYLIQSFASPWATGKIATLVAGYEADDTQLGESGKGS